MKGCLLFWVGFHETHLRASHPYLWTCCGVTSDRPIRLAWPSERLRWAESPLEPVGHLRRFWAAPREGTPRSLSPDPTFRVRPHVSLQLLLGPMGCPARRRLPEGCLPITLRSQPAHPPADVPGKGRAAWAPSPTPLGQHHPPHLGTKGFSFPELEQGRCPWTSSPGMTCTCSGDCWQIHSPPRFLTHLHRFPPGLSLSFSSITSLCALVTHLPFIATAWAPLGRVGSIKDMQHVSSRWNEKASRNRARPAQRPGASDREGALGTCWRPRAKASPTLSRISRYTRGEALAWERQHPRTISCPWSYGEDQNSAPRGKSNVTVYNKLLHAVLCIGQDNSLKGTQAYKEKLVAVHSL